MRRWLLLLLLHLPLCAKDPQKEWVPMRDGVRLSAIVTLPDGPGPFPAVLTRTPDAIPATASPLVRAGYAVIQVNLRGLFDSEGVWRLFADEIADGYDTVEWIAAQSWSNGKVGVLGSGASGFAGYLTLMSGAPHLSAGVVHDAHASPYQTVTYPGGVYQSALVDGWVNTHGAEAPPVFPRPIFHKYGTRAASQDIRNFAGQIRVPILHSTGWFDIATQGTIDFFQYAQNKGVEKARGNQKLIIHPHGNSTRLPGTLRWDPEMPAFESLSRRWFDFWMRSSDTGVHRLPPVQYYALGAPGKKGPPGNEWRSLSGWPPAAEAESFFLLPGGGLSRTGSKQTTGSSSFDYDPMNPVPSIVAAPGDWLNRAPLDQRPLRNRADILRFTSMPRTSPVEIAGPVQAELFVSTTARDTDFFVRLIDIHPDGFEALMLAQPLRLRFREGYDRMLPAHKNTIYKITVDLWSTAMVFPSGHRIGLQITSSDVPRFDRHSNTWDPVPSYDKAVKATNTVYHSAEYPSRLILPVVKPLR